MAYFERFPLVKYTIDDNRILGVNITKRNTIIQEFKENAKYFLVYNLTDGETPHSLADKFYDDPELSWIILMFNDILNVYDEWPMEQNSLFNMINDKYENPNDIHHYESTKGNIVPSTWPTYDKIPVTNFEYEVAYNDSKREIKLPLPEYINNIVEQHELLIGTIANG